MKKYNSFFLKSKKLIQKIPFFWRINVWAEKFFYTADFLKFKSISRNSKRFPCFWSDRWVCLGDKTNSLKIDVHYVYHPAWAARILALIKPSLHVDLSSAMHFVTVLSAFIPVKYYEYRPSSILLSDFESAFADLLHLPFESNSVESLSCMHVVEHVGLGRYGDPLDPDGDLKAIAELKRVVKPGGNLLFVVPVGRKRVQFNAHRVYSFEQIREYFKDFSLKDFSVAVDEKSGLIKHPSQEFIEKQEYGCGCFWFVKNNS